MAEFTLESLRRQLASGETTSLALVQSCLDAVKTRDGAVRAFLSVAEEKVLAAARAADERRAAGKPLGEYDGIPIGLKDCIAVKDERCSCASRILENFVSPFDSTVVAKLRAAGLIPFGRLNMDEFAMGSSCENSAFQKTANPHDAGRVAGGSSGGSAAAVAARLAPAALGSDTGGSIRQPAAFCGVTGMKPTYGRVSRYGVVAYASSLDQIGPITQDVLDAAILLDLVAGHDPADGTSLPAPLPEGGFAARVRAAANQSLAGVKIGLPREYFETEGIAPGVKAVVAAAVNQVRALGAETVEVSLPHTKYAVATYYVISTAEASANLARFDGIRYGVRQAGADLVDTYFKSRGAGFGDEVKRRILLGSYVLSSGYYDAYYLRAQKVRTLIRRDFEEAAKVCDILLTPVTPTVAFRFGEKSDPLQMYLSDIFTIALNLAGNCGISVPAGTDRDSGMPVGVQFMAPALEEAKLLEVAAIFQNSIK